MKHTKLLGCIAALMTALLMTGCQPEKTAETMSAETETTETAETAPVLTEPVYPVFTYPGGLYDGDETLLLELTPSSPLPEGYKIFFTSNGQEPTKRHDEYSHSFPLLAKNTSITIRAACFDPEGNRVGPIITQTYIRSRDGRFAGMTLAAVTATEADLNGSKGIFANPTMSGKEWERPAHIEIINADGEKVIDQNGGIRVFGGSSRTLPQKSLRLVARKDGYYDASKYNGKGSFAVPLFSGRLIEDGTEEGILLEKYDRFVLRNGGNDSLQATAADPLRMNLLRDNVSNTFAAAVAPAVTVQHSRMAAVFLNGEYYGILDMKEDVNDNYIRNVYGLPDKDNVTVIKSELDTTLHCQNHGNGAECRFCDVWFFYEVDDGDPAELDVLTGLLQNVQSGKADYSDVEAAFDMDSLIQYYALNLYLSNTDWPHNNVRIWRYNGDAIDGIGITDGKWRFSLRDMDFTMGRYDCLVLPEIDTSADVDTFRRCLGNYWAGESYDDLYPDSLLLQSLLDCCLQNDAFRTRFTEYCRTLAAGASRDLLLSMIDTAAADIRSELPYHLERWAGTYDGGYTMENWEAQVENMKQFVNERPAYFLAQLDAAMARYAG
ncbi:MAG: CotH kinase family protein [Clostridia bacterium]|nr:CotH kinase family protein [Clostridia bacterium]